MPLSATPKIQKPSKHATPQKTPHADEENASTATNATPPMNTLRQSNSWSEKKTVNSNASTSTK